MTKGQMIKELKTKGIKKAVKRTGELVKLEHLKTFEIFKLHTDFVSEEK